MGYLNVVKPIIKKCNYIKTIYIFITNIYIYIYIYVIM